MHNLPRLRRRLAATLLLGFTLSACSAPEQVADQELTIVVTTTILGDVVRNIVGDDGTVEVLIPIGVDPHNFSISARQITSILAVDLVITNGLGPEASLDDVFASAASDGANIFSVGEKVTSYAENETNLDPHIWMAPAKMAEATKLIAAEIGRVARDLNVDWARRGADYGSRLDELDRELRDVLSVVPEANRKLVTNHDSLGYFADEYGFEIIGTVFPGRSPDGEPSSEGLAALVETLRLNDVQVIFGETTEPSQLAEAVAAELGESVEVIELFTGSLGGPGSGAETYLDLLLTNAHLIADGLRR